MISAGSKGDKGCHARMCGCIGFQSYKNGPMPEGENNRRLFSPSGIDPFLYD